LSGKRQEKERLIQSIDKKKYDLATLCSKLIAAGRQNPPGDTTMVANLIEENLRSEGFSIKRFEPFRGFPNLVCSVGKGHGRNFVLCAHLDVFPAGSGWNSPPFSGKISNGKIHGRGAVDMKAGLAASVFAFKQLVSREECLNGRITLALFSDAENMGFRGSRWMIRSQTELVTGDACLIGEPARLDAFTIASSSTFSADMQAFRKYSCSLAVFTIL
jgi:succinyl-diaminopimelate desuccinylase